MAMDFGTNSNTEPKPEVGAVEGASKPAGLSENNQLEGAVVKSVDVMQSNNDDLNPMKEQRSNLELSAQ